MAKKRFTFADAKDKIKELEGQLELLTQLNTEDHYYTKKENNVIKFYKYCTWIGFGTFFIFLLYRLLS